MLASVQARDQLSKCSLSGSAQGELKMALSSLKDVITAHSSGITTMNAHRMSMPCEKTLRTPPSFFFSFRAGPPRVSVLATGAPDSAGTGAGVSVVFIGSVLQPLAPAQPHHQGGERQRDDEQGDADGGGIGGLSVTERLLVHVQDHDGGRVVGAAGPGRHDLYDRERLGAEGQDAHVDPAGLH